jgi:chromosomal replication initiator protein
VNYSSQHHYLGKPLAHEVSAERGAEEPSYNSLSSSKAASYSHVPYATIDGLLNEPLDGRPVDVKTDDDSADEQAVRLEQEQQGSQDEDALFVGQRLHGQEIRSQEQFDPHAVWQMLLSELALQMPSATFNTWVRDTWVVAYEDGEFIIGLPNAYARDWLENRLRNKIKRALSSFIYRSVQVQFLVRPRAVSDAVDAKPVPLYAANGNGALAVPDQVGLPNPLPAYQTNMAATTVKPTSAKQDPAANSYEDQQALRMPKEVSSLATNQSNDRQSNDRQENDRRSNEWAGGEEVRADYYADNAPPAGKIPLNGQYTFETFVVGSHNKLAHAAAEAISERPGQSFNPLFVYGGVGLGKTHLLHSIGHRAKQLGHCMLYVSSEQFTNELIGAIRGQSTEAFRNKYRQVDILLIDDIQFIGGKESTQEEFFHTFNHLHASGRQVVLSSDRPPKMLATLDDRLRSRFEGGLQADIAQPDFETRVAILQSKANRMAAAVDHSVLMMVAERVDSNIRELEGALNRLVIQARLMQSPLTLQLATAILNNLAPERTVCAPDALLRIVAEYFKLTAADLTGRKRTKAIAGARQIAMYFLREEHGLSLPVIGTLLGGRDHSTVRYGIEKVNDDLADDEALRQTISALREKMYVAF